MFSIETLGKRLFQAQVCSRLSPGEKLYCPFCSPLSLSCLAQSKLFTAVSFDSGMCIKSLVTGYCFSLSSRECTLCSDIYDPHFPGWYPGSLWLLPSRTVWERHCVKAVGD